MWGKEESTENEKLAVKTASFFMSELTCDGDMWLIPLKMRDLDPEEYLAQLILKVLDEKDRGWGIKMKEQGKSVKNSTKAGKK